MDAIFTEFFNYSEAKTGAICAASNVLASTMVKEADIPGRKNVIELGPGTGVITKEILQVLPNSSSLKCLELNKSLVKRLTKEIQDHRNFLRTDVIEASALDLDRYISDESCDCVISSLPWGLFQKDVQLEILEKIHKTLTKDGVFLTYAYWGIDRLPKGRSLSKHLLEMFSLESKSIVWKNLPPAIIYRTKKL